MADFFKMDNLVGIAPSYILPHGPTKLLVDAYHWHAPQTGIVASYTPKARDVKDHFGVFRGVDQIESFAQTTIASCGMFLECQKLNCTPVALKERFVPAFISIGAVNFHNYLTEGDTFISIGRIKFYKFRQMVVDGRIYQVAKNFDLNGYFGNFSESSLNTFQLPEGFSLIAELFDITGRALKKEIYTKNT